VLALGQLVTVLLALYSWPSRARFIFRRNWLEFFAQSFRASAFGS